MGSVAFPAYLLGLDAACQIVGISHNVDLQVAFNNQVRRLFANDGYRRLFPTIRLTKNTETEIHTTEGGYRLAKSDESGLIGFGGDILILDDFQTPEEAFSDAKRAATNRTLSTVESRINNQNTGAIVAIGHRVHMSDSMGILLQSPQTVVLNVPARAIRDEEIPIGPGRFHSRRVGDLLHPERMSAQRLDALALQDPETWAAQYQQSPVPPGGFLIKRDQIRYCEKEPRRTSPALYIQSWDTASKVGDSNSRSACVDVVIDGGSYFVVHAMAGHWEYGDLKKRALQHAAAKKPNVILVEDAGVGAALISDCRQAGNSVVAVNPQGDKKERLLAQMSKFANGRVIMLRGAPGLVELEHEILAFPGGRYDDFVDALSQALSHQHVPYTVFTDKFNENFGKMVFELALSRGRFR
jgi:predicted phage terminase large subunit-like protein